MKTIQYGAMFCAGALMACGAPGNREQTTEEGLSKNVAQKVAQTNLVSDGSVAAAFTDPNLVNAWGIAFNPAGPAWISDNGTGQSSVYDATGALKLTVKVAPPAGGTDAAPTGQVFNADATAFAGDKFIFVTEDGTISGWQPAPGVQLRVDNSAANAVYKGVTLATGYAGTRLYATNFHAGTVEVFDSQYHAVTLKHGFEDGELPDGYAPFNVQALGGHLFVAFARQDDDQHDDVSGPGNGYLDEFDFDGRLLQRVAAGGALNSPWALALAPAHFGEIGGRLLVGNFGDGKINVYQLGSRQSRRLGALGDASNQPLVIQGLWALAVGPDQLLYFTAGPGGEKHGLFGRLDAAKSSGY